MLRTTTGHDLIRGTACRRILCCVFHDETLVKTIEHNGFMDRPSLGVDVATVLLLASSLFRQVHMFMSSNVRYEPYNIPKNQKSEVMHTCVGQNGLE